MRASRFSITNSLRVFASWLALPVCGWAASPDYEFQGSISRTVLENYLARAVTHAGLCASSPEPTTRFFDDDLRMLTRLGAKFIGRAAFAWELPKDDEAHFHQVKTAAAAVHQADPEIVLQACVFEIVTTEVERIRVPDWVFHEFDLPVEDRHFRYSAMLFDEGRWHNRWRPGASVPDMTKLETQLWFYYRARSYLDGGIEAIHFGQVKLMDDADPGHQHWFAILSRIRNHARNHARRGFVICDAHTHGEVKDGQLLFDFHSYPLRLREVPDAPGKTFLTDKDAGDIFGRSKGGVTPSGWPCDSLPFLVELDNYGYSGRGGESVGGIWVWGYDEISWFAHQPEVDRNAWLREADQWVRNHPSPAHLQMPTRRILAAPIGGLWMYAANSRSEACPEGFGVEDTIAEIWSSPPGL